MPESILVPFLGGVLIGISGALLLFTHGRVAGISGIFGGLVPPNAAPERAWRIAFVGGLIVAGAVGALVAPQTIGAPIRSLPFVIAGGLLVGYGTQLSGGCTSGHGVCGVARLSTRSIVATATFVTTGAITVLILGGAP